MNCSLWTVWCRFDLRRTASLPA